MERAPVTSPMVAPMRARPAARLWGVSLTSGPVRRARLREAHLYFVADRAGLERALDGALRGGADLVQLRDKTADDDDLLRFAVQVGERCAAHGALFILNDRPDLAAQAGADGVHVGQDDMALADARAIVGGDAIVGLSTHSIEQAEAGARRGAESIGVGAALAAPTKGGRAQRRRLHGCRARVRDADEGGPARDRPRPGPVRRRARRRDAVVRDRRD